MNKVTKTLLTVGAACALAVTSFAAGNMISISVDPSVKILVNGSEFQPKDANGNDVMTFIYNGTTYAPLRALAEAYGLEVGYDAARNMATVNEPGKVYDNYDTPVVTEKMKKALEKTKELLTTLSRRSRAALIDFVEAIGYTHEEAVYGVDNCGADWYEEAEIASKQLSSYWSRESAVEWLTDTYKFTEDEANHAVSLLPDSYFAENKYNSTSSDYKDNTSSKSDENSDEDDGISIGKKNALKEAKNYLEYSSFSYEGLVDQLEYEGYSHTEAVYGADNCGADWYEQALLEAENYLDYSAFSYEGLIKQLEYEKFTHKEAVYGADNCGADWYEQAVKEAENYLDYSSFSRDGLIRQLEYEGFTNAQAVYAVNELGY